MKMLLKSKSKYQQQVVTLTKKTKEIKSGQVRKGYIHLEWKIENGKSMIINVV